MSKPTSQPRFVSLAWSATACGLLALLGCFWGTDADPNLPAGSGNRAPQSPAPADVARTGDIERHSSAEPFGCFAAPAGSTFRYRVSDRGDYQVNSTEGGLQPAGNLHLECFLTTTVLDRRAGEVLVQHQLEALRFLTVDGQEIVGDAVQASFVAAAVAPVLARITTNGEVLGYGFAIGLDGDQRNFLRGTLASVAFQACSGELATWTCDEADTTGEYEARYERLPAPAAELVAVRRTRLGYKTIATQAELPRHELRGAGEAHFSTRLGWLIAGQLDEGMTMALPLLDLQMITARRAEASLVDAGHVTVDPDQAAAWSRADAAVSGRLEQVGQFAAASERRRWEQQLQGVTLDQLLGQLANVLQQQPVDHSAQNDAFLQLQWLVKLRDAAARELGERLATGQLSGALAGAALSALGAAGTAPAQAVLAATRDDRQLEAGLREAATLATLQLAKPSAEIMQGLARDAGQDFDGRSSAMLVLGALSARDATPLADGRTPIATLMAMEADATARGDLSTWLLAVGNATPPETLQVASRHLDDQDPAVRAAACVALRRVTAALAVTVLVERGLSDASPIVRREALLALGRRAEPAARQALTQIAQNDPDEQLRETAGRLLRERS